MKTVWVFQSKNKEENFSILTDFFSNHDVQQDMRAKRLSFHPLLPVPSSKRKTKGVLLFSVFTWLLSYELTTY